ncbi:DNA polymerase III subunit delta [Patescibacteria group bacterium]|nr:DNA polymerase III subunit delta [Patescibacteria group bacterium]
MIIFLYGQDTYSSRQKFQEIIEHYKKIHKSGLNLRYFNLEKTGFGEFRDEFQQTSMFKEKKLVVLNSAFSNPEFKAKILVQAKKFTDSDDTILFYEIDNVAKNDKLFKFLKKYGKIQEFKLLDSQAFKKWIVKEFKKYQTEIEPRALMIFIDFVGNDLWRASNEIKKLVNYKKGKGEIEVKDIELLVRPKIETDVFKTIDAIAAKNKKQALELLHKHLDKGDSPLYLLSMINFQFRNLLAVKDLIEKKKPFYAFPKITKLHPFVIKKSSNLAQKFTFLELKKIYQKIFEVDYNIKTGKIKPETALDMFIAEI